MKLSDTIPVRLNMTPEHEAQLRALAERVLGSGSRDACAIVLMRMLSVVARGAEEGDKGRATTPEVHDDLDRDQAELAFTCIFGDWQRVDDEEDLA